MSRDRIASKKNAKLAKLSECGEEDFEFPSQWGNHNNDDLYPMDDEFKTLKISSSGFSGINPPARQVKARSSLSPSLIIKYGESEDEDLSFGDFDAGVFNAENLKLSQQKHALLSSEVKFLPGTLSTTSPQRRKSLSDYGEDTDTDITSEMDEDDFEEIDDIFGKEESGIYSSGGKVSNFGNFSKASQALTKKKQQLQQEAELEEEEMVERYRRLGHQGEPTTLKLKDLKNAQRAPNSQLDQDALENERTVNYEYTKDDFESFEDGFDLNIPIKFEAEKLKQFQSSRANTGRLQHKMSMPNFPNSLKASKPTKFKSTMDLAAILDSQHPVFNNSNKIIRKLDRMPSFHNNKERAKSHTPNDDELNHNMELRKKQLLEKYMEITEQQKNLKTSPKKSRRPQVREKQSTRKGVGLVKYLNEKSAVPATSSNGKMKFDTASKRWEGNEHDLMRFEENETIQPKKQPSLITVLDFQPHKEKLKGNMMYDAENLRWVNLDKVEEEDLIFDDLPDLVPNDVPQYKPSGSKLALADRGVSTFTHRTTLTASSSSSALGRTTPGDEFQLLAKLMSRFEKEEVKIKKKTHHWFGTNEHYKIDRPRAFNGEYFWEIRKMVVDDNK